MISLSRDNHIIERPQFHAQLSPGIEMSLRVDRSSDTLILPHTPELLKGCRAVDRRLIGSRPAEDLVY